MQKLLIILSLLVSSSAYAGQTINQLPTPIPVANGGTGLVAVGTSGLCVLSNGTGLEYGSCGGTAGAGGSDRQMQFNDSSVLSGTALLTVGTNALSQGLTTFTAKPTFVGVGTTTASINIPVGTQAPSSPVSGDVWVTDGMYVRVGTTTQGPLGAGGSMTYPSGTGIAVVTSGTSWGTTLSTVAASGDVSIGTTGAFTVTAIQGVASGTPTGTGSAVYSTSATITTPTLSDAIYNGFTQSSAALTATSNTTLADITGLAYTTSGGTYNFDIWLNGSANASGGLKVLMLFPTSAPSAFKSTCWNWNATTLNAVTTVTANTSNLTEQTAAFTDVHCKGSFTVGITTQAITLQAAQNASNGSATTVNAGSTMNILRVQ